jgi:pimeloyl-ACP methyl ester carboxylesterase
MQGIAHSTDGVAIRYESRGSGQPALVLVHGWSCDRRYWRGQVDHFAARGLVVTVDLAGHGESGFGRDAWTMPAFGDDVVAVIEQLGLERVVLAGHSMGGDVIVEAALRLPDRVVGLVWVDDYSRLGKPRSPAQREASLVPFRDDFATGTEEFVRGMFPPDADPELVEWVVSDMASAPPEVAIPALEQAWGNHGPILERLPLLSAPLVAINAAGNTDVASLRRYGIETMLMPGVGHFLMLEDAVGFDRVLDGTLDRFAG